MQSPSFISTLDSLGACTRSPLLGPRVEQIYKRALWTKTNDLTFLADELIKEGAVYAEVKEAMWRLIIHADGCNEFRCNQLLLVAEYVLESETDGDDEVVAMPGRGEAESCVGLRRGPGSASQPEVRGLEEPAA